MKYTKSVPVQSGFYWVKWSNYKPFIVYIFCDEIGAFTMSQHDNKTKIYLSDDPMHSYSDSPIPEPE